MGGDDLRVLMCAANFPDPHHPFVGVWNRRSADAVARLGVDLEVIAPVPYAVPGLPHGQYARVPFAERGPGGYPIHHPRYLYAVPKRLLYALTGRSYAQALRRQRTQKPDIIHARHAYPDAVAVNKVPAWRDIPLVVDVHGPQIFNDVRRHPGVGRCLDRAFRRAALVLCVSEELARMAVDHGVPAERVKVSALGGDSLPSPQDGKTPRKRGHLLYVGQLIPRKGVNVLLDAFAQARATDPTITLTIVGHGPSAPALRRHAASLGLDGAVTFRANCTDQELADALSSAAALVLPSFEEGRPTVIYEAMWAGRAVIATAVNGVPEQVVEDETGYLVAPGNASALAEALLRVATDEALAERLGARGRDRARDQGWSWTDHGRRIVQFYNGVGSP